MNGFFKSIKLDSFNVEIILSERLSSVKEILESSGCKHYVTCSDKMTIIVTSSKLWELDIVFRVGFFFPENNISMISISPESIPKGREITKQFSRVQKALNALLGPPSFGINTVLSLLSIENKRYSWNFSGNRVEHTLSDRFGVEEKVRVFLKTNNVKQVSSDA